MFSTKLGVWMTPDPIGYDDGGNRTIFCSDNPINYTDPTGLYKHAGSSKFSFDKMNVWNMNEANSKNIAYPENTSFYYKSFNDTIKEISVRPFGVPQKDEVMPTFNEGNKWDEKEIVRARVLEVIDSRQYYQKITTYPYHFGMGYPMPVSVLSPISYGQALGLALLGNKDIYVDGSVEVVWSNEDCTQDGANEWQYGGQRRFQEAIFNVIEENKYSYVKDYGLLAVSLIIGGAIAVTGVMNNSPSGFGTTGGIRTTSNINKGTWLPQNLREQLAIEQAAANPTAGVKLPITLGDKNYLSTDGWVKMEQKIQTLGGGGASASERITVHYVYNTKSQQAADFKIVTQGARPQGGSK